MQLVESAKKQANDTMEMFLRNFSKVPDDKLLWTPTSTTKTALRIAAHTALYAGRFAHMIRDKQLPAPENLEEWLKTRNDEEIAVTDRSQIEPLFRAGTQQLVDALDSLSQEDVDSILESANGGRLSMKFLMTLPATHNAIHMGQIDFLQTCWGDDEVYVG